MTKEQIAIRDVVRSDIKRLITALKSYLREVVVDGTMTDTMEAINLLAALEKTQVTGVFSKSEMN